MRLDPRQGHHPRGFAAAAAAAAAWQERLEEGRASSKQPLSVVTAPMAGWILQSGTLLDCSWPGSTREGPERALGGGKGLISEMSVSDTLV